MLPFRSGKFFRDFPNFLHRPNGVRELRQRVRPDGAAPFSAPESRGARTASACSPFPGGSFSAPADRGTRTASACSPLTGGSFSAPESRGTRTALAGSPFPGGEFFAEPQRGIRRLRTAGTCRAPRRGTTPYPRRGAKRKGHLRFPFLFELLPFPCFLIWRRLPICDRFEKGNGRGFFLPCFSQPVRRVRYRSATHVIKSMQAQHDRVAQFVSALS